MRLLIVLLLASLALAGLLFLTRSAAPAGDGRGVEAPGPVEHVASTDAATPTRAPVAPGRAPEEGDGDHGTGDSELAAPAPGLEDRPRTTGTFSVHDFEQRFQGWSTARLNTHLLTVERAVTLEQEALFEASFERGQYQIVPFDSAAPEKQLQDVLSLEPPPGEIGRTRVVHDPESSQGTPVTTGEYHFATLSRGGHPEFYERLDERDWLRSALAERQDQL